MNAAKSLSTIFKVNATEFGKYNAASTTSNILQVVIYRLLEEGLEVNEKNITDKLELIAKDYIEASSSNVA